MTFNAAHARIVEMIEAVEPTHRGLGLGDAFAHDPKGNEDRPGAPGRRFWMVVDAGGGKNPSASFSRRHVVTCAVTVEYPAVAGQFSEATIAIADDAAQIGEALASGKWQRASSSIIAISASGQDLTVPWTLERGRSGWRLRLTFTMEYER